VSTPAAPEEAPGEAPAELVGRADLTAVVRRIAREVSAAHPDGVVLVSVLKASVWFVADLIRAITVPVSVDFLAVSSFRPGAARVRIVKDLENDIQGRDVVLVEAIADTGLTLTYLIGELGRRQPRSLQVCALLDRRSRRIIPTPIDYVGFVVGDEFVLGYGLDYAERYRNIDRLVVGDLRVLQADPAAYVPRLFQG